MVADIGSVARFGDTLHEKSVGATESLKTYAPITEIGCTSAMTAMNGLSIFFSDSIRREPRTLQNNSRPLVAGSCPAEFTTSLWFGPPGVFETLRKGKKMRDVLKAGGVGSIALVLLAAIVFVHYVGMSSVQRVCATHGRYGTTSAIRGRKSGYRLSRQKPKSMSARLRAEAIKIVGKLKAIPRVSHTRVHWSIR